MEDHPNEGCNNESWVHPFHSVSDTQQGDQVISHPEENGGNGGVYKTQFMIELWCFYEDCF
jgi:hypothetical protein